MRLRILSDLHLEFGALDLPEVEADVVILAGDIHIKLNGVRWAMERFPDIPVVYVPGNHEFFGAAAPKLIAKLKEATSGSNVQVLSDDAWQFGDVTILGSTLWSDFFLSGDTNQARFARMQCAEQMTDYKRVRLSPAYRKLRPQDTELWHRRSVRWMKEQIDPGGRFVIVTHHAPSLKSIPEPFRTDPTSAAYASNLDELVERSKAAVWIHGHIHQELDYVIGDTRVICNPRGYPDEPAPGFQPELVVEI